MDMSAHSSAGRRIIAELATHARWSAEPDRTAALQYLGRGLALGFARQVGLNNVVSATGLAERIENTRAAPVAEVRLARVRRARARRGRR
jgi:hypothetical protein